jgi:hypothetical protein
MKIKQLLPILLLPVSAIPVAYALSSCSSLAFTKPFDMNIKNITSDTKLSSMSKTKYSLQSLCAGNKSYNNGNYVVMIGCSSFPGLMHFISNDVAYDNSKIGIGGDTVFTKAAGDIHNKIETKTPNFQMGYALYLETDTLGYAHDTPDTHEGPITPFDKYDQKDQDINAKHKKDAFVRNDSEAKNYRHISEDLNKIYGDKVKEPKDAAVVMQ